MNLFTQSRNKCVRNHLNTAIYFTVIKRNILDVVKNVINEMFRKMPNDGRLIGLNCL